MLDHKWQGNVLKAMRLLSLSLVLVFIKECNSENTPSVASSSISSVDSTTIPSKPSLNNLLISRGNIDFDPSIFEYNIPLYQECDTLEIVPILDSTYTSRIDHPVVHIGINSLSPILVSPGIGVSLDVSSLYKTIFSVVVEVYDKSKNTYTQYKLLFDGSLQKPSAYLEALEVTDQDGDIMEASQYISKDVHSYQLFTQKKTKNLYFKGVCHNGGAFAVNSKSSNKITRDHTQASQLVTIECTNEKEKKAYFFDVRTESVAVPPPSRLAVVDSGKACKIEDLSAPEFVCTASQSSAAFLADIDSEYSYVIRNNDGSVMVRLVKDEPSALVDLNSGLYVEALNGHIEEKKTWKIHMNGKFFPRGGNYIMQIIGWFLGSILLFTAILLFSILTFSTLVGIGSPFGASEVPTSLIFLLQYFCFATIFRGTPTFLGDVTTALKYVTFFWPGPWVTNGEISLIHLANAQGCLFWTGTLLTGCFVVHCIYYGLHRLIWNRYALPHSMKIGNWESRIMHAIVFPVTVASCSLITHESTTIWNQLIGACTLMFVVGWAYSSFKYVKKMVQTRKVVWVWNQGLDEPAQDDLLGYWVDLECDQLHTEPADKSVCGAMYPWKWSSTVGDIEKVKVYGESDDTLFNHRVEEYEDDDDLKSLLTDGPKQARSTAEETYYTDNKSNKSNPYTHKSNLNTNKSNKTNSENFSDNDDNIDEPVGRSPCSVFLRNARTESKTIGTGIHLIAGLYCSRWIDILFTYRSITALYEYSLKHNLPFLAPLTVKVNQLSGPITGGGLNFHFDGIRVPFTRSGDFLYRIIAGICLATGLLFPTTIYSTLFLLFFSATSAFATYYSYINRPFSREVENRLVMGVFVSIAATSFQFAIPLHWLTDILMWCTGAVLLGLSLYAAFIGLCIVSAFVCPPTDEYKFFEKLCNTQVVLSDHAAKFKTSCMAYNRYGSRDLLVKCSRNIKRKLKLETVASNQEPTLEIDAIAVLNSFGTGNLQVPKLCLFVPSPSSAFGYLHLNMYERYNFNSRLSDLLENVLDSEEEVQDVTEYLSQQVKMRSFDSCILSITFALDKLRNTYRTHNIEDSTTYKGKNSDYTSIKDQLTGYAVSSVSAKNGYTKVPSGICTTAKAPISKNHYDAKYDTNFEQEEDKTVLNRRHLIEMRTQRV